MSLPRLNHWGPPTVRTPLSCPGNKPTLGLISTTHKADGDEGKQWFPSLLPACPSVSPAGEPPGPRRLDVPAGGEGPDVGPKLGVQESHTLAGSSPVVQGDPLRSGSWAQMRSPETTRWLGGSALDPGVPGSVTRTIARAHARTPHFGTWYHVRQQVSPKEGGWRARTHCRQHTDEGPESQGGQSLTCDSRDLGCQGLGQDAGCGRPEETQHGSALPGGAGRREQE